MEHMLRGRTATRLNVHMPKRSTKLRTRGLALLIMAIGALLFPGVLAAAPSGGSQGGVTDSNLVAYWPFDAGSTRDVSGNNNDGVGSGITPTSDRFGRHNDAYQFDGVDDSISITNSPTLQIGTSDYTIAAWIRTTAAGSDGRVFSKGSWNCTTGYMMRLGGGDKIHLENASNGWCMVNVDSNTPVTDGAWHFVVGVVDRDVGAVVALQTSVRAVLANPVPMAVWGFIVGAALAIGSLPFFIGLAVVMPVLAHATWHIYRKVVERPAGGRPVASSA